MMRFVSLATLVFCLSLFMCAAHAATLPGSILDDFRDHAPWRAIASDQVHASLRADRDGGLCLDYDFAGVSGYAVMRRALPVSWPAQFDLVLRMKGSGAANDFQLKLIDASGDNVWWMNRQSYQLPTKPSELKIRRRHIDFAWGPTANRELKNTAFIEFVIAAGNGEGAGGKGSLCVAGLKLNLREPDPTPWPEPRVKQHAQFVEFDYGQEREFNGLLLDWPKQTGRVEYEILGATDPGKWQRLRRTQKGSGVRDAVFLPESETRYLRIRWRGRATAPTVLLQSAQQWPNLNAVIASLAAAAPRGELPRAFLGEQNYWTLVGRDGGGNQAGLMSEDGAIEMHRGGYSIEPVVLLDDQTRATWADVQLTQHLRDGYLPVPSVHWQHAAFSLTVEAAADSVRDQTQLLAHYQLRNNDNRPRTFTLLLAVRPWQVNPPQQFLATPGGASPIDRLNLSGATLTVNSRPPIIFSSIPTRASAQPFEAGVNLDGLMQATPLTTMRDQQRHASAALQFRVTLAPGATHTIAWASPLDSPRAATVAAVDARIDMIAQRWRQRLNRVKVKLPTESQALVDTLRTSLAHILISRDGPALRPGTRAYARSWVRDGAMMVAGLVRMGETGVAREFVDWYATYIFDSGKVPCCVDSRGADPVVENDSHGQFIFMVAELWRHTRDRALLERHWPAIERVLAWQEALRQSERGDNNRSLDRKHLFGLMPPSISHEGYSDKPAYSYWDNFWALRGYKDAVQIALALEHETEAVRWSAWRDEYSRELVASLVATAAHHRIKHLAGAADRGDFDPTSTTIALSPADAQAILPTELLVATFERYWQEMSARTSGNREWKDYTPYEWRNVSALVRLGSAERAHAMSAFFFNDQRPPGWNQWAEVVLPNTREVRFLGDMPHAWVSSDYIGATLDLFAYEREHDEVLVIGAGWKPAWLRHGIEVAGLSTAYGVLDYQLMPTVDGWTLLLPRSLEARGGVRLRWPGNGQTPNAVSNGQPLMWEGRELIISTLPASIVLSRPQ
jgi:hypothetical protein